MLTEQEKQEQKAASAPATPATPMHPVVRQKFNFWQEHSKNVLLLGRTGVGKTAIIRDNLELSGLKLGESLAYFSPHSNDFVGDPTTAKSLLFDDLNDVQAQKAVKEILGLRVWKGKPIAANVWGAFTIQVTLDKDGEYVGEDMPGDVYNLFEIKIEMDHMPGQKWFAYKYGERLTKSMLEWWDNLSEDELYHVNPRMLDSALKIYLERGDVRDVLPVSVDVSKLVTLLNVGPTVEKLEKFVAENDVAGARTFMHNLNTFSVAWKCLAKINDKNRHLCMFFLPLIPKEQLSQIIYENNQWFDLVLKNCENPHVLDVLKSIVEEKKTKLSKKVRREMLENPTLARVLASVATIDGRKNTGN